MQLIFHFLLLLISEGYSFTPQTERSFILSDERSLTVFLLEESLLCSSHLEDRHVFKDKTLCKQYTLRSVNTALTLDQL